jgi:hypothetical protein
LHCSSYVSRLGAKIHGVELGVKIHGAELMPHLHHVGSHFNDTQKMALDIGANDYDAKTCNLGANCNGVKIRVYFLKDTGRIFKNLLKK